MSRDHKYAFNGIGKSASRARTSLRQLFSDSSELVEYFRSENYPIFESNIATKNPKFRQRTQSYGDIISKNVSPLSNTNKKRFSFAKDEEISDKIYRNQSSEVVSNSYHNIITKACLLRNDKKKSRNFYFRNANPSILIFPSDISKPGIQAQPKLILPRNSPGEEPSTVKLKSKSEHLKIINHIKRKKKTDCPKIHAYTPVKSPPFQRDIQGWDYADDPQEHF